MPVIAKRKVFSIFDKEKYSDEISGASISTEVILIVTADFSNIFIRKMVPSTNTLDQAGGNVWPIETRTPVPFSIDGMEAGIER